MNDQNIEVESSTLVQKTVIWLHGLGADGNDFASLVPELQLPSSCGIRFIFPHAPVIPITINNGYNMRAWYDIQTFSFDDRIDHQGIAKSMAHIHTLIKNEMTRGITESNIILAGFSQGAVMALVTGLTYPRQLGGIIALSGYLPDAEGFLAKASAANQHSPIYIAHGTQDPIVPYSLGERTSALLRERAYPVTWQSFSMPHSVCKEEILGIGQWLQKRFHH